MKPRKQKPPRKPAHDFLLSAGASANEATCHAATAPLDRLAIKMDEKWGVDRLIELVSVETASRYGSAMGRLNEALREHDAEQCRHMAQVCMRGLAAMDREATEAGAPRPELLAELELDGFHFGIMKEGGDWRAIKAARPDLRVFSLAEVAVALGALGGNKTIGAIKDAFPQSEIRKSKMPKSIYDQGGDVLPF